MYQNNPNPEPDFVSGLREGGESGLKWIQRLTDSYGLLLTLSGEGSVTFGKEFLLLHGGDLILLHPGLQHRVQSLKTWDYLWFHFLPRSHVTHALKWPEPIPGVGKISFADGEFQTVRSALLEAHFLEYERPGGWNALACLLLESVLVRGYNRFLNDNSKIAPPIRTAQKLLTERDDSIDQIAASCGISRAALYAKFKQETGISPRQYREYAMLRRAAHLLESTTLSIAEIADQIGIPDPYYFSTRFRKFSGTSPREYRKRKNIPKESFSPHFSRESAAPEKSDWR